MCDVLGENGAAAGAQRVLVVPNRHGALSKREVRAVLASAGELHDGHRS